MDGAVVGAFVPSLAPPIKRWIKERETVLVAVPGDTEGTGLTAAWAAGGGGVTSFAAGAGGD